MAVFLVKFKKNGKIHTQKFRSKNQSELDKKLQDLKVSVLEIQSKEDWYEKIHTLQKPKIKEISSAFYQFKLGLRANLPLKEILNNIQKYTKNQQLKTQFSKINYALHQGKELPLCFKEAGFSEFICAMIEIGQKSGNLMQSVEFILLNLKNTEKIQKYLKKILLYPLFVLVVMVLVFLGITLFVLPQFESLFLGLDSALPWASRSLLFMRFLVLDYGLLILLLLVGVLWLGIGFYRANKDFRIKVDLLLLSIPLFGRVLYYYQTSQFLLCFYWLYKSNLELKEVLGIAIKSVSNAYLSQKLQGIYINLTKGVLIAESFERIGIWDSLALQLLYGAKNQEGFLESLELILSLYQDELQDRSERLLAMIEPLMILILGILVLWLALGIFLPLWELPMQIRH